MTKLNLLNFFKFIEIFNNCYSKIVFISKLNFKLTISKLT